MKVLVVDDSEAGRKLLRLTLEADGHQIEEAADGLQALERLDASEFDAVISDILMPKMDGYRLCYEVRRSAELRDLPILIYSSTYTSPSDEALARRVGADKFIRKPASSAVILEALKEIVRGPPGRPVPGAPG
jgi:CheY-like chemotaxis protein